MHGCICWVFVYWQELALVYKTMPRKLGLGRLYGASSGSLFTLFSDQYLGAPFSQRCLLPLIFLDLTFYSFVSCIGCRAASGLGEANEALQALFVGTGYQQSLPGMLT